MHLPLLLASLLGATALAADDYRPCGFKIAPCPTSYICEKLDPLCDRGENCAGRCIPAAKPTIPTKPRPTSTKRTSPTKPTRTPRPTYQSCGGMRIEQVGCPKGYICVDDPRVKGCGMACDRPGICVQPEFCGGFAGFACKDEGKICVDDPRDDCDPLNGGADCGGICV
ncbi:hypothetical protein B0T14DRAFT_437454 [Immersiella caudata]|uniref:Uncharacterized protein n=1 Tax=Immersiella caudata TaxID=314043 RepID=A0AA39WFT7_9PEZI|nr:hypothetical protein B0T14DRAFT_437454 [Immersiella caudata]